MKNTFSPRPLLDRSSVSGLVVGCIVFFVACVCNARYQQHHVVAHPIIPNRMRTEWEPNRHYSADVEEALTSLAKSLPQDAAYLRSNGVPITPQDGPTFQRTTSMDPGTTFGSTSPLTSHIYLNQSRLHNPLQMAAAIGHEVCHVRYGDPAFKYAPPGGRVMRWLLGEEPLCHVIGDKVQWKLGWKSMPPDSLVPLDAVENVGILVVFVLLSVLLGWVFARCSRNNRSQRAHPAP
jgi:hypothetical protein